MGRVSGKIALVTGGGSGIGEAAAQALAREGASVVVSDIDKDGGRRVAGGLPNAIFHEHDVRDEEGWRGLVEAIRRDLGRLDILFNNAGVVRFGSIEDCTLEDYRFINSVMSEGTFLGCKYCLPLMASGAGGSIVNMGSIAGIKGIGAIPAYTAAKGAIQALTRSVAAHCREADNKVRCNAIVAGSIRTPMTIAALAQMSPDSASYEELEGHGQGRPEDVANLLLYLASDESSHMNGASIVLDNAETS